MRMKNIIKLCDEVREIAFAIHVYHGPGHLEKVYEKALAHRLRKKGHKVEVQYEMTVLDEDGTELGSYYADLLVDDELIVEIKAAKALANEHVAQVLGYLKSTRKDHGLLLNFGAEHFEIRKYVRPGVRLTSDDN